MKQMLLKFFSRFVSLFLRLHVKRRRSSATKKWTVKVEERNTSTNTGLEYPEKGASHGKK